MKNILPVIRRQITYLSKQKNTKKYSITPQGLQKFVNLKPRSQQLLNDLLLLIGPSCGAEAITLEVGYAELGFKDARNFYRYRDELVDARMIFIQDRYVFVNPCFINYLNHRQKSSLFSLFKLNKPKPFTMGKPVLRLEVG